MVSVCIQSMTPNDDTIPRPTTQLHRLYRRYHICLKSYEMVQRQVNTSATHYDVLKRKSAERTMR